MLIVVYKNGETQAGVTHQELGLFSSDSFMTDHSDAVLVTLPKEIDIPVRFNLRFSPRTDSEESSWYVAIVYEDEVPFQTNDPPVRHHPRSRCE
ncbi:hypothetical protein JFT81_08350 [Pseudomonas sp. TH43]|nr:hypothetical protein [Pseudomonas sp. TH43]